MLGAECVHLSKGNVSGQVLHCIISNKSVEKNRALVQNFSEKTSENFAL
jgi:flagellar biosynthesis/type III secretory pathway chaperone